MYKYHESESVLVPTGSSKWIERTVTAAQSPRGTYLGTSHLSTTPMKSLHFTIHSPLQLTWPLIYEKSAACFFGATRPPTTTDRVSLLVTVHV